MTPSVKGPERNSMKEFTLTTQFPVSAMTVYKAWLDSEEHEAMTGGAASIEATVGSEFTAWDGYIWGKLTKLVEGKEITQTWKTSDFAEEDEDSIVSVRLKDTADGCEMELIHSNIPDESADYYNGWQSSYFAPMLAHFSD